jgi:mono/diheme cytochrome c family protein
MNSNWLTGAATASLFLTPPAVGQPTNAPVAEGQAQWGTIGPWALATMRRQQRVVMYGIPAPYASLRDPLPNSADKLKRGAAVFRQHCVACHGPSGFGTGPAGKQLSPPPANLEWLARMPSSRSGPYMYWTIAEGGKQFESAMPSFKKVLSPRDIWSAIAYVRDGLGASQGPR